MSAKASWLGAASPLANSAKSGSAIASAAQAHACVIREAHDFELRESSAQTLCEPLRRNVELEIVLRGNENFHKR